MQALLASQLPSIAALCERFGVAQLELFGSATGPDFKPEASDFDFLVELDRQAPGSRAAPLSMTDKAPKLLFDAVAAIESAQEFMAACSLEQYASDQMRRSAVERQLEILGEACSRLARIEPALLERVQNLKLAIDLRNRIIHGYDAVDDEIVYLTVTEDLVARG